MDWTTPILSSAEYFIKCTKGKRIGFHSYNNHNSSIEICVPERLKEDEVDSIFIDTRGITHGVCDGLATDDHDEEWRRNHRYWRFVED